MTDSELEAHFKKLYQRLEKIEKSQAVFVTDLEKDRGDLHDFSIEVAKLGAIVEGVHKGQKKQTEKIVDRVEEAVVPVIDEAHGLRDIIKNKKFIRFRKNGQPFWKFWKR